MVSPHGPSPLSTVETLYREIREIKDTIHRQLGRIQEIEDIVSRLEKEAPPPVVKNEFGREDVSVLPDSYLRQCILDKDVAGMLETLLFDDEHPENRSVCFVLSQGGHTIVNAALWRNGVWETSADVDQVLLEMLRMAYRIFARYVRQHRDDLVRCMDYDLAAFEDLSEYYEHLYDNENQMQDQVLEELQSMATAHASQRPK
jgi:hypothetical protein